MYLADQNQTAILKVQFSFYFHFQTLKENKTNVFLQKQLVLLTSNCFSVYWMGAKDELSAVLTAHDTLPSTLKEKLSLSRIRVDAQWRQLRLGGDDWCELTKV